jgi:hypothetical protein
MSCHVAFLHAKMVCVPVVAVSEYKEPSDEQLVPDGSVDPTSQVGTLRLVVNRE